MDQFVRSREGLSFFANLRQLVHHLPDLIKEMKRANDLKEIELGLKKVEKIEE